MMESLPLMHDWDGTPQSLSVDRQENRRVALLKVLAAAFVFVCAAGFSGAMFSPKHGWRRWAKDDHDPSDGLQELPLVRPTFKNTTKPTLTSTADCAGDYSRPVLAGADVVEYFNIPADSSPVIGKGHITVTHNGYLFFFSSTENQRLFKEDPHAYMPAWGGFCSYGIAAEDVWTPENLGPFADPSAWIIGPDERLHVFRSQAPEGKFSFAAEEYIKAGNTRWESWFGGREGPLNTGCFCTSTMCPDQ